eukprot:gene27992-6753_t
MLKTHDKRIRADEESGNIDPYPGLRGLTLRQCMDRCAAVEQCAGVTFGSEQAATVAIGGACGS